jgi:hypothetical protein
VFNLSSISIVIVIVVIIITDRPCHVGCEQEVEKSNTMLDRKTLNRLTDLLVSQDRIGFVVVRISGLVLAADKLQSVEALVKKGTPVDDHLIDRVCLPC